MDIAAFAESFMNTKLPEWQKDYIRTLYKFLKNNPNERIYINVRPHQGRDVLYTYFKANTLKELTQNGTTPNSH